MPFPQTKEVKMWTKDEMRTLFNLWESHSTEEIADVLGRNREAISYMAKKLRQHGLKIAKKKRVGVIQSLIKEFIEEM